MSENIKIKFDNKDKNKEKKIFKIISFNFK